MATVGVYDADSGLSLVSVGSLASLIRQCCAGPLLACAANGY